MGHHKIEKNSHEKKIANESFHFYKDILVMGVFTSQLNARAWIFFQQIHKTFQLTCARLFCVYGLLCGKAEVKNYSQFQFSFINYCLFSNPNAEI